MANWGTESQTMSGGSNSDWLRKCSVVEQELRKIKSESDHVDELLRQIRGGQTTPLQVKDRIHFLSNSTRELCTDIVQLEKFAQNSDSWDASEKKARVRRLHEQSIAELARIQRLSAALHTEYERSKQSSHGAVISRPTITGVAKGTGPTTYDPLKQDDFGSSSFGGIDFGGDQSNQSIQQQVQSEEEESIQRERAMRLLEADISQVNEVFTTLATIVHEQKDMVDSIEANTETAHVQVVVGNDNLAKAVRSRNAVRKKRICFVVIGLVVLLIIILIIVFSTKA